MSQDPDVLWEHIVATAKTNLEEELEEKRTLITRLMDERNKVQIEAKKIKGNLILNEFSLMSVREKVCKKQILIKMQEEEIKMRRFAFSKLVFPIVV